MGKSALASRYLFGVIREEHVPTYEDTYLKTVVVDGEECEIEVIDTPGREEDFYKVLVHDDTLVNKVRRKGSEDQTKGK